MIEHTNCKTKKKLILFEHSSFISNNLTFPVSSPPLPSHEGIIYVSDFLGIILICYLKAQQIITKKHDPAMNKISKVI